MFVALESVLQRYLTRFADRAEAGSREFVDSVLRLPPSLCSLVISAPCLRLVAHLVC